MQGAAFCRAKILAYVLIPGTNSTSFEVWMRVCSSCEPLSCLMVFMLARMPTFRSWKFSGLVNFHPLARSADPRILACPKTLFKSAVSSFRPGGDSKLFLLISYRFLRSWSTSDCCAQKYRFTRLDESSMQISPCEMSLVASSSNTRDGVLYKLSTTALLKQILY